MSGSVPTRMRFEVLERDEFSCQYCGAKAPCVELHVDHVVPACNGGPTEPGNLITACGDCNRGKGGVDLLFVPDHILERAGNAYDRGAAIRHAVASSNGEADIPAAPADAPNDVLNQITSEAQALSVSIQASRLSQAYIAGAVGVSPGYLSIMRSGKRAIPENKVGPLCAATGSNLLRQFRQLQTALGEVCEVERLADMLRQAA